MVGRVGTLIMLNSGDGGERNGTAKHIGFDLGMELDMDLDISVREGRRGLTWCSCRASDEEA